mgnify:FL=1
MAKLLFILLLPFVLLVAQPMRIGNETNQRRVVIAPQVANSESKVSSESKKGSPYASIEVPKEFLLKQNYPNPFNPSTVIEFGVPSDMWVSLKVFNVLGREVATLVNERLSAGFYTHNFDASGLPSGLYFYKLQSGDYSKTMKMTVMK